MWTWLSNVMLSLAGALAVRPKPRRSPLWPKVRATHLAECPRCAACGRRQNLEVHHVMPVHVAPELELDPTNLITLCDAGEGGCHLRFGHLMFWKSWNVDVLMDVTRFSGKVRSRP